VSNEDIKSLSDLFHEFDKAQSFADLQNAVKKISQHGQFENESPHKIRIAVLSNYSTQFLVQTIRVSLKRRGWKSEIFESEYNTWELEVHNPDSELYRFNPDIILLALSSLPLAFQFREDAPSSAKRIIDAVKSIQNASMSKVLVSLPEALAEESDVSTWSYAWRGELESLLKQALSPTCALTSFDPHIRNIGAKNWFAPRYYVTSKLVFHPQCTKIVAEHWADLLISMRIPTVKLVITDLDNTLWNGIVGDQGAGKIDLDFQEKGISHLRIQRFLKHLKDCGVLLAIASKNEESVALEVFNTRKEMILKESDFVARRINWKAKSENIESILKELNLSTQGVVFLDDSDFEREEVRQAFPDLTIPHLAKDPALWLDQLIGMGIFNRPLIHKTDQDRTQLYHQEEIRTQEKSKFADESSFLKSLNLILKVHSLQHDWNRVFDLIGKTNQFNVTTRRHNQNDVRLLLEGGSLGFCLELEDRFGSHGIVAVFIARPLEPKTFLIDTWLMSCRVFNRKVEHATMELAAKLLFKMGIQNLKGEFIRTVKNKVIENLFTDLGFLPSNESGFFDLNLQEVQINQWPHYCKIEDLRQEVEHGRHFGT